MFKGEYGICDECAKHAVDMGIKPQERWIVVKKPYLCKVHNDMRKKGNSPKPIKKDIKKHIKPVKKATGEAEIPTTNSTPEGRDPMANLQMP